MAFSATFAILLLVPFVSITNYAKDFILMTQFCVCLYYFRQPLYQLCHTYQCVSSFYHTRS